MITASWWGTGYGGPVIGAMAIHRFSRKSHGRLDPVLPYASLGQTIGTGILPRKHERSAWPVAAVVEGLSLDGAGEGTRTPHSQLRQVSLGFPVCLSMVKRPLMDLTQISGLPNN
jgi:hypothetical protein